MSFLASELIEDVSQELSIIGQRVSESDFLLFINRANKYFYTNYTMPTAQRNMQYLLFSGVYEYPAPSDFASIGEFERPFEFLSPNFLTTRQREFMHWLQGNQNAFKFNKEKATLLVNWTGGEQSIVNGCDTVDQNGTWVASGDASNAQTDQQYFVQGTGALRFTVTHSSGQAVITNTDMPQIDISQYTEQGFLFLDIDNPNDEDISSISVKIGTDSSNYYQMSATQRYSGTTIGQNWGAIGFDFSQKTTVGTPTDTNTVYVEITLSVTAVNNGTYRLDNIFCANPIMFNLPYYSIYNIKGQDGTYKEKVTETGDEILCPFIADEAYSYKVGEFACVLKLQDSDGAAYFREQLTPKELALRAEYPRQTNRVQTNYYPYANDF